MLKVMTDPVAPGSAQTLTHPGQLIANLPAVFGFYPNESVVFATFHFAEGTAFRLGPVLRVDVGDLGALAELERRPGAFFDCDLVFCVVVSAKVVTDPWRRAGLRDSLGLIEAAVDASPAVLAGVWGCEEILTGAPFVALGRSAARLTPGWEEGVIASVAGSVAMAPWAAAGRLPEISRSDTFERFSHHNPHFGPGELRALQDWARKLRPGDDPDTVEALGAKIREGALLSVDDYRRDAELLRLCAVVLGDVRLRDAVVGDLLGSPAVGAEVMLAAATSLDGEVRANALSLYALAVIAQGFAMDAPPALITALEESPRHSLSLLLLDAVHTGMFDPLLRCVAQGSEVARRGLARS